VLDAPRAAVDAGVGGDVATAVVDDPRGREDGVHRGGVHVVVLRCERIDRRCHHHDAVLVEALPGEGAPREDAARCPADVGKQEVPGSARVVVGRVHADVTAPDHAVPGVGQRGDEPGRLGVVEDDDVALAELPHQLVGVAGENLFVMAAVVVVETFAVAGSAVEPVVDALGDHEEPFVAADHQPAGVDTGSARVGQQGGEHLRHPAALGRGVDVPDGPALEHPAGLVDGRLQRRHLLVAENGGEALRIDGTDLDLADVSQW
jgi:hypothetical protein